MRYLVLIAALLLGGCFGSDQPLYSTDGARCPFLAATFAHPQIDADGATVAIAPAFKIRAEGPYCRNEKLGEKSITDNTTFDLALYTPLQGDWMIVQSATSTNGDKPTGYAYGLARITTERVEFYVPQCGDFTANALRANGIAEGSTMCPVTDARQIESLFKLWIAAAHAPPQEVGVRMRD